jgi:hypothetical protein
MRKRTGEGTRQTAAKLELEPGAMKSELEKMTEAKRIAR